MELASGHNSENLKLEEMVDGNSYVNSDHQPKHDEYKRMLRTLHQNPIDMRKSTWVLQTARVIQRKNLSLIHI